MRLRRQATAPHCDSLASASGTAEPPLSDEPLDPPALSALPESEPSPAAPAAGAARGRSEPVASRGHGPVDGRPRGHGPVDGVNGGERAVSMRCSEVNEDCEREREREGMVNER